MNTIVTNMLLLIVILLQIYIILSNEINISRRNNFRNMVKTSLEQIKKEIYVFRGF